MPTRFPIGVSTHNEHEPFGEYGRLDPDQWIEYAEEFIAESDVLQEQ